MTKNLRPQVKIGQLSEREVARRMGLASTAAVSRQLQALGRELPSNPTLRCLMDKASQQIKAADSKQPN